MKTGFLALLPVLGLVACGGSNGGNDGNERDIAPERPSASVSGTGFDGLIIDGDVNVREFRGAILGKSLGTSKTDSAGYYSASITSPDMPIHVSVSNGYYIEEASGTKIQLEPRAGFELQATDYYTSGSAINVSATFFTTLATGLTEYLVKNEGLSTEVAIERAYAEIDAWAGFDTRRVVPLAVNDVANASPLLLDGHKAGYVAAGISQLTRVIGENTGTGDVHLTFSSIGFIQKAYEDIKTDGVLNGVGAGGNPLSYGNLVITADTYRTLLSTRMLQFASSDFNMAGIGFDGLTNYAHQINAYAGELFNYTEAPDILETYPTISSISVPDLVQGTVPFVADIDDVFGIESVVFYVNGENVGETGSNAVINFDSEVLQNGSHQLTVEVTNYLGNVSSVSKEFNVNNGEIAVSLSNKHRDDPNCGIEARLEDSTGMGLESLRIDNLFDFSVNFTANSNVLNLSYNFGGSCHSLTIKDHINPAQTYYIRSNRIYSDCKEWKSVPGPFGNISTCARYDTYCSYSLASGC